MKRVLVGVAVLATVFAMGAVGVSADMPTFHCVGNGDESFTKVEGQGVFEVDGIVVTVDGSTVTFTDADGNPVVVDLCVKAAGSNSGIVTGSSFTVDWTNEGGNVPDISYVVLFGSGECEFESCEPTEEPPSDCELTESGCDPVLPS